MWIVRHHDDGLAVIAVQSLQQTEDFIPRFSVQIAGRLVAKQQGRVGDNSARDASALLFATDRVG
jgi:hypothetical protein